jgi:inhibitor of cysteine peptidase
MTPAAATLTDADNGQTIDVHVDDTLVLRLPENPSTGYRWTFDALDPAAVNAQDGEHTNSSGAVGGGGETTWTLTPKAPGTTHLALKLWRHWEGDTSVKKRFAVTLSVKA